MIVSRSTDSGFDFEANNYILGMFCFFSLLLKEYNNPKSELLKKCVRHQCSNYNLYVLLEETKNTLAQRLNDPKDKMLEIFITNYKIYDFTDVYKDNNKIKKCFFKVYRYDNFMDILLYNIHVEE